MSIEVHPVAPTKDQLSDFVKFGIRHYDGNDCFVPPLAIDDINTLRPDKNPAFDFYHASSEL